jgi:hypothetical protein
VEWTLGTSREVGATIDRAECIGRPRAALVAL